MHFRRLKTRRTSSSIKRNALPQRHNPNRDNPTKRPRRLIMHFRRHKTRRTSSSIKHNALPQGTWKTTTPEMTPHREYYCSNKTNTLRKRRNEPTPLRLHSQRLNAERREPPAACTRERQYMYTEPMRVSPHQNTRQPRARLPTVTTQVVARNPRCTEVEISRQGNWYLP